MSLYGKYIKERLGKSIVESEYGFATYYFVTNEDRQDCYVEDVFVERDVRREGVASGFVDAIAEIAKEKGCKSLYTTVVPSTNGSTDSMKAILTYGFKLSASTQNMILFSKDLEG